MGKLGLPPKKSGGENIVFDDVSSVVIVGANGSGKSRFGAWIENPVNSPRGIIVQRVAAQRALPLEEFVVPRPLEQAQRMLVVGHIDPQFKYERKTDLRWQRNPTGHLLNDYDAVLAWLFADQAKPAVSYHKFCQTKPGVAIPAPMTRLDHAVAIWQAVIPHRELVAEDHKITARIPRTNGYAGRDMSDGERVILYLIGQCLAAPSDAVIVIDEPELHLHQAIQARLWDQIEAARPDCVFVYITHDLNFAASRTTARKVWVRDFDGSRWDWKEVPPTGHFPESLALQILGSRRPILFVEGDESSLDLAVYRALFPERLVLPRQSCERVVQATAALRSLPQMHHTDAYGLIDRDRRSDDEIATYAKHGVYAADVAEVENLLLLPEVIQSVSRKLMRKPDEDFEAASDYLFRALRDELTTQIHEWATFRVRQRLDSFGGVTGHAKDAAGFSAAVAAHLLTVDPTTIYRDGEALFRSILDAGNFAKLLRHYNRKSLATRVAQFFGLKPDGYPDLVIRMLRSEDGESLRRQMRAHVPQIPLVA